MRMDSPSRCSPTWLRTKLPTTTRAGHISADILDDDAIESADWAAKKKKPSASSAAVYDITDFDKFTGSATMNSPAPHTAYNLTAAKVKASDVPTDYVPLESVEPIKAVFKGKGGAKRKRDADGVDNDDGGDGGDGEGDDNND